MSHGEQKDLLLACLVYLTQHFGRTKSAKALVSGLPYDEKNMGPDLFCKAAEANQIAAQIVRRKSLSLLKEAVFPAVAILQDKRAIVILSRQDNLYAVYNPVTDSKENIASDNLESLYVGFAILVRPKAAFNQAEPAHHENGEKEHAPHWFWSLVESNRGVYGMAMLAAVFVNLFALTSPLFIMNVYDRVIPNNAIETGWALGIGALVIYGFDLAMRVIRAYMIDFAGRRIDVIAAGRIFDQVLNMRIAHRPRSSGVFASMLKDFDSVRDFFTSATITVLVDLPFSLFFLFIIYKIGGPIALILAGLIIAVFIIGLLIQIPLKKSVKRSVQSSEAKHGLLVETIGGLETIKTLGADGLMRARYMSQVGENALHSQTSRFWSGLGVHIAGFLQNSASVIVVLLGMYLVRDQALSMGGLIACVMLGGRAISPIGQIANLMTRYHQAGSALRTIESIMAHPVDRPNGKQFLQRSTLEGKITFDKVSFSYPHISNQVLTDVTFQIKPGEKVGVIGRIGSGKSTITKLLLGLYSPDSGTILLDDTDMRQIDPVDANRNIAYISQDIMLFSGSVRDNIALSKPHASEDEILAIAKASGVHDFISRHPMGYDAPVGEHGSSLSGGQKQAIGLARAMLVNPQILVCDEPTNAMDSQAEKSFRDYIEKQIGNRTLILITHKQHMLDMVDRLILLDRGKVIIDGPRADVLRALSAGDVQVEAS